jgi:hypothetical protein
MPSSLEPAPVPKNPIQPLIDTWNNPDKQAHRRLMAAGSLLLFIIMEIGGFGLLYIELALLVLGGGAAIGKELLDCLPIHWWIFSNTGFSWTDLGNDFIILAIAMVLAVIFHFGIQAWKPKDPSLKAK